MSQTKMFPPKDVMCHMTAFKESCHRCVTEFGCRKWSRVQGRDIHTDAPIDLYDCADHWGAQVAINGFAQLSQKLEMVAKGIDHLRIEVQGGNVKAMLAGINDLNGRVNEMRALGAPIDPAQVIEDKSH